MWRIHFTADDLARTRLRPTLGPLSETVFALGLLQHPVGRAHHRLRGRLAKQQWGQPINRWLQSGSASVPAHLLSLIDRTASPGSPEMSHAVASASVRRLWHSVIEPNWGRINDHLCAEADWRARLAMRGGMEKLLSVLHPKITWEAPVLTIAGDVGADVRLGGGGLVLVPSAFLAHKPAVLVSVPAADTQVLVFAAPPADADAGRLLDAPDTAPRDLGALVGRTRAAALRELIDPCTTSELACRLGVSNAGVSQHTAVLRDSGLITTRRFNNRVLHSVTPLGLALLGPDLGYETVLSRQPSIGAADGPACPGSGHAGPLDQRHDR